MDLSFQESDTMDVYVDDDDHHPDESGRSWLKQQQDVNVASGGGRDDDIAKNNNHSSSLAQAGSKPVPPADHEEPLKHQQQRRQQRPLGLRNKRLSIESLVSEASSTGSGIARDEFGVSALSMNLEESTHSSDFGESMHSTNSGTFDLGRRSYTLDEGGEFMPTTAAATGTATSAVAIANVAAAVADIEQGKRPPVDEETQSLSTVGSQIRHATGRAMERVHSVGSSSNPQQEQLKREHKKRKKKKKSSRHRSSAEKQRDKIRQLVERSTQKATLSKQVLIQNIPKIDEDTSFHASVEGGIRTTTNTGQLLPQTSDLLSASDFNSTTGIPVERSPSLQEVVAGSDGKDERRRSRSDRSSNRSRGSSVGEDSLGNFTNSSRYQNETFLLAAAQSKFQKGLYCTKKKRYSLARSKFRAALKARILLHEDIQHVSIAPVHEMIGSVERKLGNYEKSRLHLLAALEICEVALKKLDEDEEEILVKAKQEMETDGKPKDPLPKEELIAMLKGEGISSSGNETSTVTSNTSHIGTVNTARQETLKAMAEQRTILQTNIARIKKTIEVVKIDAIQRQLGDGTGPSILGLPQGLNRKSDNNLNPAMMYVKQDSDDSIGLGGGDGGNVASMEAAAAANSAKIPLKLRRSDLKEEATTKVWAQDMGPKPEVVRKTPGELLMEALKQQQGKSERQLLSDIESKSERQLLAATSADDAVGEQQPSQGEEVDTQESDDDNHDEDDNNHRLSPADEEIMKYGRAMSWALDSIIEEKETDEEALRSSLTKKDNDAVEVAVAANEDDEDEYISSEEEEEEEEVPSVILGDSNLGVVKDEEDIDDEEDEDDEEDDEDDGDDPAAVGYRPKSKHPQPPQVLPAERHKRISTQSEQRLRTTYHKQSQKGEEYYNSQQYAMAIASFNDAKFALLIISGLPEEALKRDNVKAVMYAKLRDQINSALLSERITDCHVEKFFKRYREEEMDDYSHVNYRSAATLLAETKKALKEQVEIYVKERQDKKQQPSSMYSNSGNDSGGDEDEEEEDSDVNDLKDLITEATLSLARIYSKQGAVYTKLNSHLMALDLFADSISAWEEAAELKAGKSSPKNDNLAMLAHNFDVLIIETHEVLKSHDGEKNNASSMNTPGVNALRNTTNLKALSVALQMVNSYYALGTQVLATVEDEDVGGEEKKSSGEDMDKKIKAAIDYHISAINLVREAQRLRAEANMMSSLGGGRKTFVGAAMNVMAGGRRMTTRARDLSVLKTQNDSKDLVENLGSFMKRCTVLEARQQICIAHAAFRLGFKSLSKKWLLKAVDILDDDLGISKSTGEIDIAIYILSVTMLRGDGRTTTTTTTIRDVKDQRSMDGLFSFYEGGLPAITEESDEKPRVFLHFALAALQKGLHMDAKKMFKQATEQIIVKSPRTPPNYYDEVLHAIDAQIIIEVKVGNMEGAVEKMNRLVDVVSQWFGRRSLEMAKGLHRLGCLHSILGDHEKCLERLEESLSISSEHDEYDALDSMKLLATTHEALRHLDSAMIEYDGILSKEKDLISKAKLMNAIAHLHVHIGDQNHLAVDYLDKSLNIQQNVVTEVKDINLLVDTMILYGNAMASNKSFTQAIYWFESALNSNPEKSPLHPNNLRAWYNKGVTLFRKGDVIGAGHAFGIILDELENTPDVRSGTAFVLNAVGSIFFANRDYEGAIERFEESLSLKNDDLSPCQKAGTICNIATSYFKMANYEESEASFDRALSVAESAGGRASEVKATIMSKFGYVLYKRRQYIRAYKLFSNAAELTQNGDSSTQFSKQCDQYAEMCRLRIMKQDYFDEVPKQKVFDAQKPQFQSSLIPITDGQSLTKYSDAVYSLEHKMLLALGADVTNSSLTDLTIEDFKVLGDRAIQYILTQTKDSRANYALVFEGVLAKKLNRKFEAIESWLDNEMNKGKA